MDDGVVLPTATILAGGLSRRMFAGKDDAASGDGAAGDKGLLSLGAESMLAHVVARVRPQCSAIMLNANGDPARFSHLGLPIIADPLAGHLGPLAGVLAGLRWTALRHPRATHTLSVASDAPFLPRDLTARLSTAAQLPAPGGVAVAASGGRTHPVIGLWPVALADDLEAALQRGERKAGDWAARHAAVTVEFPFTTISGQPVDPFFNANTPEDLAVARRLLDTLAP